MPVAHVGNGRDVLAMDHFVERGVFVERAEGFVAPRSPFLMSASPVRPVAAAPRSEPTTRTVAEQAVAARRHRAAPSSSPDAGHARSTA